MEMLFLGGVFSKEIEKEILINSKGTVHYAANKFQWILIDGIMDINGVNLEILSAPFIAAYPNEYNRLFFGGCTDTYKSRVNCKFVPFCNLWGVKNISRKNSLIKAVNKFIVNKGNKKVILVYSPHTPFVQAAVYAKRSDPSIHICLIVPDLPKYMNLNEKKSILYTQTKKLDIKIFERYVKEVDSFVLITEHMKEVLKVGNRPYVVVEGAVGDRVVYSEEIDNKDKSEKENVKSIVYTGTLNKKFGIVNLLKAFYEIKDPNISLDICGRGDAEDIITEYAKKDTRVHYIGQLTNEEATRLQRRATVLINPRQNSEDFTKYSFPSKNTEYILSGNPLIAYKLDGIPDEYDDYIFYVEDDTIESLKKKIVEVINLTDEIRHEFGKRARRFILENKGANKSCLKIFNMIDSTFN